MVKTLMLPEAWNEAALMPRTHKDMYSYSNAVMEPWDGPAAIAAYGSNWVIAGMDRNGLRPMRYTITADGLIIAGSETGMVKLEEANLIEKGRLDPGQLIGLALTPRRL